MKSHTSIDKLQFIVLLLVLICGALFWYQTNVGLPFLDLFIQKQSVMRIGEIPVEIEIADDSEERRLGLSGREELVSGEGLLMVFEAPGYHGIWMKEMRFPIDVIWIGEDLNVIDLSNDLDPKTYPKVFEPHAPARYILETNSLFIETFGIQVGDSVTLPRNLLLK